MKNLLLLTIVIFCVSLSFAQETEYDDLYFTKQDRQKLKKKKEERRAAMYEKYEKKKQEEIATANKGFGGDDDQYFYWIKDDSSNTFQLNDDYTEDWSEIPVVETQGSNTYHYSNVPTNYYYQNTQNNGQFSLNDFFFNCPSNTQTYSYQPSTTENKSKDVIMKRSTPIRRSNRNAVRRPSYSSSSGSDNYFGRSSSSDDDDRGRSSYSSSSSSSRSSSSSTTGSRRRR